jgi:ABC-type sugar transport system permease subunit
MLGVSVAFLLPTFLLLTLFMFRSIADSFYLSFTDWNGVAATKNLVGFLNWQTLVKDQKFMQALGNNLRVVVLSLVVQMPIALLLAFYLYRVGKKARPLKVLWFFPLMMSSVSVGYLWKNLYDPNYGLIAATMKTFGHRPIAFLGDPSTALNSVIAVICWQYIPFYMLYFLAAFSALPVEVREAATIDGASTRQFFFSCALPMMRASIKNAVILSVVGSLKYFDLILVMTEGGPSGASNLMATYMYRTAFWEVQMSYGSTIASAMFLVITVFSLALTFIMNRGDE